MKASFYNNVAKSTFSKNCLLKYTTEPFFPMSSPAYHHHQFWQVPEMVKILNEFGYNVDAMNGEDKTTKLTKQYDLLIDHCPQNHSVYCNSLKQKCHKVFYSTDACPSWHNSQHELRIKAVNARKHARLQMKASLLPLQHEPDQFDALFLAGNPFTFSTFAGYTFKQVSYIKNSACFFPDCDVSRKSPSSFLFFATYPQVLKGLDLLLEVFAKLPNAALVICSQFQSEKDFCAIYNKELYQCPNILPVGFVDIKSQLFRKVLQVCSYAILPSCSEGISGSILTAMSAGLIPIVSRECGISDNDAIILEDCTIDCLRRTIQLYAQKPLDWVQRQARITQHIARNNYSIDQFATSFRSALHTLLNPNTAF